MLDLGFGNSVAIRQAFLETCTRDLIIFGPDQLNKFDYPDRLGDPELVEFTKKVIKRQTGQDYRNVVLTNGATGGVVISLRSYFQKGFKYCNTRKAPYYLRYPNMINASGLIHFEEEYGITPNPSVILLDIPSNPLCFTHPIRVGENIPVVLDGVYLNNVYTNGGITVPKHNLMVGSYSKLLGMGGIRVGWIATNDDLAYERLKDLVTSEYCGISMASTEIIKNTLKNFDWDKFEQLARFRLDCNREQWSKLESYFSDPIPQIGMFHFTALDKKVKKLLEKSGITWTAGSSLGVNDNFGRFNLGQDPDLIQKAVKTVLKEDNK